MSPQLRNAPDLDLEPAGLTRQLGGLDYDGYWHREPLQVLWLATGFALLYGGLTALAFALDWSGDHVAAFWPAAGLLVGVMGCTPRRIWPLWILAAVFGRYLAESYYLGGSYLPVSLCFSAASSMEALLFALLIARPLEQSYRLRRPLYLIIAMSVVAFVSSLAGGLLGAGVMQFAGGLGDFWENAWIWVAADYLGMIIVAPTVAWLLLPQIRIPRAPAKVFEFALYMLVVALVITIAPSATPDANHPYGGVTGSIVSAATLVPVVWSAVRFKYLVTGITLLLFATLVVWASSVGIGPFGLAQQESLAAVAPVQVYLIVTIQAMLFIAFGVLERERAVLELDLQRSLQDLLVSLSNKLLRVGTEDIDRVIEKALEEVARYAGADRSVLFQIDAGGKDFSLTHSWFAPGAGQRFESLSQGNLAEFGWAREQLAQRGYFTISDLLANLPPEYDSLRNLFPATASGIYIGLFSESRLFGCIGFVWLRRSYDTRQGLLPVMHLVGQLFGNVVLRLNVEKKLDNYQSKLRSMAREISLSEERARRRAAIDLHDSIGQNLAVAKILLGRMLATGTFDADAARELQGLLDTAMRGTRYIISDLSPAILYELGLVPAIRSLAQRFEPINNVHITVTESGTAWDLTDDLRIELYRAARELMTNIAKHADAQTAHIEVAWAPDSVGITVEDDGVGFEASDGGPGGTDFSGFGLFNVREEIQSLGGSVSVESSRGIGTKVALSVPRKRQGGEQ